ncbi:MAG: hypothetical protein L0Y72_23775 [Gemmataceae bacterium]|nr:hypothetical protein [Gemmataceae bacterium]MCI0742064.1 hypothetical protein [Gemmataceae bacterium]
MICVLLLPLLSAVLLLIYLLFVSEDANWVHGTTAMSLLGLSSLGFVYLGKLQACSDGLLAIELAVLTCDQDGLTKAISTLSCYSRFGGLLNDVKRLAE